MSAQKSQLDLHVEYVPLAQVIAWPRNPKLHDIDSIDDSISRFGFVQPLTVDERTGKLVAGHGRLEALQRMQAAGKPAPERVRDNGKDWLVPVIRGVSFASEADAEAYLLADNRLVELGGWDNSKLLDVLTELSANADSALFSLSGFEISDIAGLTKGVMDFSGVCKPLSGEGSEMPEEEYPEFPIFSIDTVADVASDFFLANGVVRKETPLHMQMQEINRLANTETEKLIRTTTANRVADHYHFHRIAVPVRKPAISIYEKLKKPYAKDWARKAVHWGLISGAFIGEYIQETGVLLNRGSVQVAGNFRPGYALYLYRKYVPEGGVILDTSAGFGGRLVAAIAHGRVQKYVGIDPSTETQAANKKLAEALAFGDRAQIIVLPAEDVDADAEGLTGKCDFAFTSPPYFAKEQYSEEETQSFKRYPEYAGWVAGFLQPVLRLQYKCLKPGAVSVFNIDDVTIDGVKLPLAQDAISAGKTAGFTFVGYEVAMSNSARPGNRRSYADDVSSETAMIFRKD